MVVDGVVLVGAQHLLGGAGQVERDVAAGAADALGERDADIDQGLVVGFAGGFQREEVGAYRTEDQQ